MIREEFNKLDINSQVNYFNNELKNKDNNFNAICKQLGISKNTILSRFKKEGLLPVKEGQKIIGFNNQLLEIKEENLTSENSEVKNIISENSMMKNKKKASDPNDINIILNRIELLEQKVKELESAKLKFPIDFNAKLRPIDFNAKLRLDKNFINSYENTTTKTFKIDVEVYKKLENIFDKYKMYKKQDIVSSLLKYALDNI